MKNRKLLSCLVAVLIALGVTSYGQSELISQIPGGVGKQIVSIHSYSAHTKHEEGAANLLLADQSGDQDKWCDNTSAMPWVIFELSNLYDIDKIVIRDARIREKNNGNIAAYDIYVTNEAYDSDKISDEFASMVGWDDTAWELAVSRTEQGDLEIKEEVFSTPLEKVRYVKFVVRDKGVRYDNKKAENAVRVYGFDIYGTFAEQIDRDNLISVGKSVLGFYEAANKRESAANLLDGNLINVNNKYCFKAVDFNKPYPYIIIDLEQQYDISSFKIYDCKILDGKENNFAACDIYVSEYAPDLSKISVIEDLNTNWTQVVNSEGAEDQSEIDIKEYDITPKKGRFVKIVIPSDRIPSGKATRLYQIQVYGTPAPVAPNDATLALMKVSQGSLTPAFDPNTISYSVNVVKEVENITITASANSPKATLTGNGKHNLSIGANPIKVKVVSEDTSAEKEYTINVTRADKSEICTLDTLFIPGAYFATEFNKDSLVYNVDVKYGVEKITIGAEKTQSGATIEGLGEKSLTDNVNTFTVKVTAESGAIKEYTINVYKNPENLISVNFGDPKGKRIASVLAYSGKAHDEETPYKLFIGERQNTNGNKRNKWCDDSNENPWVILSLSDIYEIEKIVIRDAELMNEDANMGAYKIDFSVTGIEPGDFETAAYQTGGAFGSEFVVDELEGLPARYIKFSPSRGQDKEKIMIYGFDIYGTLLEKVDRKNLVSVGKTIVDYSSYASNRETPHNLIDGNIEYTYENESWEMVTQLSEPWAFSPKNGEGFVVIDLEEEYDDIKEFKLYETNDYCKGYKVSLSSNGSTWEEVISKTFEPEQIQETDEEGNPKYDEETGEPIMKTVGPGIKTATLEEPKSGRYVKVDFPLDMQTDGSWNRVREFEVYTVPVNDGLDQIGANNVGKLSIYPNPVVKGNSVYVNDSGDLKVYTLQGALVYEQSISGATYISTSGFTQGSYIISLVNEKGIQQAKLVVK